MTTTTTTTTTAAGGATTTTRMFKCKCGEIQFDLIDDPVLNCNCHCHSCVASCRYVDEKKGGGGENGTSGIKDHGCAFSFYKPNQFGDLPESLNEFGCVKVGPNGKNLRFYTNCCGTFVGFATPKLIGINRNAIYDDDNTTYVPSEPVMNGRKGDAFDPSIVPEPNHNMFPLTFMMTMMGPMINPFGPTFDSESKKKQLFFPSDGLTKADIVEITW